MTRPSFEDMAVAYHNDFEAATIEYIGVDGSVWTLSGPGMGAQGVELGRKPRGLYAASGKSIWTSGAFQEGATYEGVRWEPRDMVFKFNIFGRDGYEFEEIYARWAAAWSFDRQGTLVYISPISGRREMKVQLLEAEDFEPEFDPRLNAHGELVMTIRAARPWWTTEPELDMWRFDGTDFNGELVVSNPTDRPCYLRWVLKSPAQFILPDFSFADDEHAKRMVRMPYQKLGTDVTVDTRRDVEQVKCTTIANYWALMNGEQFMFSLPANTPPTKIPVFVDPLPLLPFDVPVEWSIWLANVVTRALDLSPHKEIFDVTPEEMAAWIADAVRTATPDFMEDWKPEIFSQLVPETIAKWITQAWGSLGNMAGSAVTVACPHEWSRPFSLSEERSWEL